MSLSTAPLVNYSDIIGSMVIRNEEKEYYMGDVEFVKEDLTYLAGGARIVITDEDWLNFDALNMEVLYVGEHGFKLKEIKDYKGKTVKFTVLSAEHIAERGVVMCFFVFDTMAFMAETSAVAILQELTISNEERRAEFWEPVYDEMQLRSQFSDWFIQMKSGINYNTPILNKDRMLLGFTKQCNGKVKLAEGFCQHYKLNGVEGGYELSDIRLHKKNFFPILDLASQASKYIHSLYFDKVNWTGRDVDFIRLYKTGKLSKIRSYTVKKSNIGLMAVLMLNEEQGITVNISDLPSVTLQLLNNGVVMSGRSNTVVLRLFKGINENPTNEEYTVFDSSDCVDERYKEYKLIDLTKLAVNQGNTKVFARYLLGVIDKYLS